MLQYSSQTYIVEDLKNLENIRLVSLDTPDQIDTPIREDKDVFIRIPEIFNLIDHIPGIQDPIADPSSEDLQNITMDMVMNYLQSPGSYEHLQGIQARALQGIQGLRGIKGIYGPQGTQGPLGTLGTKLNKFLSKELLQSCLYDYQIFDNQDKLPNYIKVERNNSGHITKIIFRNTSANPDPTTNFVQFCVQGTVTSNNYTIF